MTERRSWRFLDGVLVMALAALAIVTTWSIWVDVYKVATRDVEQSHILLAPLVAAWLVWVRRERLRLCRPRWTLLGPAVVLLGYGMVLVGFARSTNIAEHTGALVMLLGAALTIIGPDSFRRFAPAVAALAFVIPIPGRVRMRIADPLQDISARIAHFGMELFGVAVTREGNVLVVNGIEVAVAEACNGMRMVAALALVSFAFVFSAPMRNSVRVGILAISPLVAIVCNVVRLVPTALLYGYANHDVADTFHDVSGWLMLFVALGVLWSVVSLLRWIEIPVAPYEMAPE